MQWFVEVAVSQGPGGRRGGRHRSLGLAAVVCALGLCAVAFGCEDEPQPVSGPSPLAPGPTAAPRGLATATAFDLISIPGGAVLFYGPSMPDGGGLWAQALDVLGRARGDAVEVWGSTATSIDPAPPYVLEVAAASGGGRAGVAWIAREGERTRVYVSRGAGTTFSPALPLGESSPPTGVRRGNVAVAAAGDGTLSLIHRTSRAPCVDGVPGDCARLRVTRIGDSASNRRDMHLVIPEVCDGPVPGYLWADGSWYYSLCVRSEGSLATTVYAIQFEPSYAQADRILPGCEPLGLGRVGEGAALALGRCADGRIDAVRYGDAGTKKRVLRGLRRRVRCNEGRPRILIGSGPGQLEVRLTEATGDLSPLLPDTVAPPRSQALWTGEALLVALPLGSEVVLHRYQCEGGAFVRRNTP